MFKMFLFFLALTLGAIPSNAQEASAPTPCFVNEVGETVQMPDFDSHNNQRGLVDGLVIEFTCEVTTEQVLTILQRSNMRPATAALLEWLAGRITPSVGDQLLIALGGRSFMDERNPATSVLMLVRENNRNTFTLLPRGITWPVGTRFLVIRNRVA